MALALRTEAGAEAELAAALALDLEGSFESVVIAYRRRIVTFVARVLHEDASAEDVAQEVFVRAYRALQSYEPERRRALRLGSWLYAIAHNLARNALRDAPPKTESLEREDGSLRDLAVDRGPSPERALSDREALAAMQRAVAALSPRLRAAFVLRYLQDVSYDDIAHILQQPVGTVKASAHRGRIAVRAHLENDYD